MTYRTPYLHVAGPDGEDMMKSWGSRLIGVKLTDRLDGDGDEAIFMFTRKPPYMPVPGQGTPYTVRVGWTERTAAVTGQYTLQKVRIFGHPKQGQQLHLICRAADFIDHLKRVDSEHFDEKTGHKTLSDVFNTLFKSSGAKVLIHPDIAKIPLPGGYKLRWNQSVIDFAAEMAEANGATVKPMDGKILVLKNGSGESVSGQEYPTILMPFDQNYEFDFEIDPRFDYAKVSASYLDTDKGTLEREDKTSKEDGPRAALPHPFADAAEAKRAAEAKAYELKGYDGTGLFTKAGDPTAVAGAPVTCSGFGTPIDTTKWEAAVVTHDIVPTVGWTTTVETKAA